LYQSCTMSGNSFIANTDLEKHPMQSCQKCGAAAPSPDAGFCGLCGSPLFSQDPGEPAAIPWETAGKTGIIRALLSTLRECLFSPLVFFTKVSGPHNTFLSFVYALILGSIGSVIGYFWTNSLLSALIANIPWLDGLSADTTSSAAGLILIPLLTAIKVLFATVYFQTLLTLTRTSRQGIKATLGIVCYAESTAVFNLIPLIGSVVAVCWSLYLLAVGFNRVHRMSTFKALVIILLPLLILGFFGILALALVAGAASLISGSL
jgi:hypothetical protein